MTRFALLVTFRVRPEHTDACRAAILHAAGEALAKEPDCLRFEVAQDEADPARFVLFEVYTDAAALTHHHAQPHFLAFAEASRDWIVEKERRRLVLHGE